MLCTQQALKGFPGGSVIKNPPANAGDMGSISESGRSSGGGNGNPVQYSRLENPKDRGTWWATVSGVTKSRLWLSEHTHAQQMLVSWSSKAGTDLTLESLSIHHWSLAGVKKKRILPAQNEGDGGHGKKGSHQPASRIPPLHCCSSHWHLTFGWRHTDFREWPLRTQPHGSTLSIFPGSAIQRKRKRCF